MDNVINLFHRDILTLRSHHWKYFMNTYTGCSYCCAYCLNAYTNDFYKKIKIDENIVNEIDEKLKNIDKRKVIMNRLFLIICFFFFLFLRFIFLLIVPPLIVTITKKEKQICR